MLGLCQCDTGAFGVDCAEGDPPLVRPPPKGVAIYVYEMPQELSFVPLAVHGASDETHATQHTSLGSSSHYCG